MEFQGILLNNRYRVGDKLAAGGMGAVYLGRDEVLGKQIVVKVPHASLLEETGFRERFDREIQKLLELEHPNILRTLAKGEYEGVPYLVLPYVGGGNLQDKIRQSPGGRQSLATVGSWLPRVAETMDFVHKLGVVHRDIKPSNILFDEHGNVFLADFGIAKAMGDADTRLTMTGMTPGSPFYMAPEQMAEGKISPAADQYALGVTLYEALTGVVPFPGKSPITIGMMKQSKDPPDLADHVPSLPREVCATVLRSLERKPGDRHVNCRALATAFVIAANKHLDLDDALDPPAHPDMDPQVRMTPPPVQGLGNLANAAPTMAEPGPTMPQTPAPGPGALPGQGDLDIPATRKFEPRLKVSPRDEPIAPTELTPPPEQAPEPSAAPAPAPELKTDEPAKEKPQSVPIPRKPTASMSSIPLSPVTAGKRPRGTSKRPAWDLQASRSSNVVRAGVILLIVAGILLGSGALWQLFKNSRQESPEKTPAQVVEAPEPGTGEKGTAPDPTPEQPEIPPSKVEETPDPEPVVPPARVEEPAVDAGSEFDETSVTPPPVVAPVLEIALTVPIADQLVSTEFTLIKGTISPADAPGLRIVATDSRGNSAEATLDGETFLIDFPLEEGLDQTLTITAVADGSKDATLLRTVHVNRTPPSIELLVPRDGLITALQQIDVDGSCAVGVTEVRLNGERVRTRDGRFEGSIELVPGINVIQAVAHDRFGIKNSTRSTVTCINSIAFELLEPPVQTWQPESTVVVKGTVRPEKLDGLQLLLTVNDDAPVTVRHELGQFEHTLTLDEGINQRIVVEARAPGARTQRAERTVSIDLTPPRITLVSPAPGQVLDADSVTVTGTVDDPSARVTVSGQPVTPDLSGSFSMLVPLGAGTTSIKVSATDRFTRDAEPVFVSVTRKPVPAPPKPDPRPAKPEPVTPNPGTGNEAANRSAGPRVAGFTWLRRERFSAGGQSHDVHIYSCDAFARKLPGARGPEVEFSLVKGGTFQIGSTSRESKLEDEKPQRSVTVGDLLVARTEVTQEVWAAFAGGELSPAPSVNDRAGAPVDSVSWKEVRLWCQSVGSGLRLPSEAEWEHACRGGTSTAFFFGDEMNRSEEFGWLKSGGDSQKQAVAGKKPNAYGLYDTIGNVWEWCEDAFSPLGHEDLPANGSPKAPDSWTNSNRVVKGGSFLYFAHRSRSASRHKSSTDHRAMDFGFRPVCPVGR